MSGEQGWQELFGYAFRRSRNAMVLLDEQRVQLDFNGAYLKLLGYDREDLLGQPIYELTPDGPVLSAREWVALLGQGDFTGERELTRADGTPITVLWGAHPESVTGQRLVLLVALTTERWGRRFRRDCEPTETALSDREREVVRLVAHGLDIAQGTVRTHVRNAMEKLGARSRAHLVAKAVADGIVVD